MKTLIDHEKMEMLVLDEMRKIKILDQIAFGGGTMLRLCYDLNRYSTDFDFYLLSERDQFSGWSKKLTTMFEDIGATITDKKEKHFSFLWEIKLSPYPRKLKIEIRKNPIQSQSVQLMIAHSQYSTYQVRLKALTLAQMWENKISALTDRNEIRDAYDLEFLARRRAGNFDHLDVKKLKAIHKRLNQYTNQDFKVKLGSVLSADERQFVLSHRFAYLKSLVEGCLSSK